MKNIAEVFYFLALRNGFHEYLQIDNKDTTVMEKVEAEKIFQNVNCLHKTKVEFEATVTDAEKLFDMIFIVGKNFTREALTERIRFAESRLKKGGAIVFDYGNPTMQSSGEAWQCVARIRCNPEQFICVIADAGHGCAVYRPHMPSLPFAKQYISQYDNFEYLLANRAALLNIVTWAQFELLIKFF